MESLQTPANPDSSMSGFSRRPPPVPMPEVDDDEAKAVKGPDQEPDKEVKGTPEEEGRPYTYEERVKTFGLSIDQALKIVDDLALGGAYQEDARLSKSVKVTLVTRTTRFNSFLAREIDMADPKKMGRMNQLMSEWQLAASLERYGDQPMAPLSDEMKDDVWAKVLQARRAWVLRLPGPIFMALCTLLVKFDAKILTVLSDGYEANF